MEENYKHLVSQRKPVPPTARVLACGLFEVEEKNMPIEGPEEQEWRAEVVLRMRAILVVKDLRNSDAARMLGITEQRLGNWLSNIAAPTPYLWHLFSKRFGVSLDYLLNGDVQELSEDLKGPLLRGPKAAIRKLRPEALKEPVLA